MDSKGALPMRLTKLQTAFVALLLTSLVGCQSGMNWPRWDWWRTASNAPPDTSALARSAPQFPELPSAKATPDTGTGTGNAIVSANGTPQPSIGGVPGYPATRSPGATYPSSAYPTTASFDAGSKSPYSSTSPAAGGVTYPSVANPTGPAGRYPTTLASGQSMAPARSATSTIRPQSTPYVPSAAPTPNGLAPNSLAGTRNLSGVHSPVKPPSRYGNGVAGLASAGGSPSKYSPSGSSSSVVLPTPPPPANGRYSAAGVGSAATSGASSGSRYDNPNTSSSSLATSTPPAAYPTTSPAVANMTPNYRGSISTPVGAASYPATPARAAGGGVVPASGADADYSTPYRPGGTSDYRPTGGNVPADNMPTGAAIPLQPLGGYPTTGATTNGPQIPAQQITNSESVPPAGAITNPYVNTGGPTSGVAVPASYPATTSYPTTGSMPSASTAVPYNPGDSYRQ